jgi:hypothetical protein
MTPDIIDELAARGITLKLTLELGNARRQVPPAGLGQEVQGPLGQRVDQVIPMVPQRMAISVSQLVSPADQVMELARVQVGRPEYFRWSAEQLSILEPQIESGDFIAMA